MKAKNALVGFIEVKAPGKGADPRRFKGRARPRARWDKLKSPRNPVYTDGNAFSLWRDGKRNVAECGTRLDQRLAA